MEGDSVTLNTDDTETQRDDEITWRFGQILLAKINKQNHKIMFYSDSADGRFRNRLKLDQTGSLIITNTRSTDSGLYKVHSSRSETPLNTFSLTVYAPVPVPVITRYSPQCSSSSSSGVLLCSVVNVSNVTLSWYKGNSLLSSINVSDFRISLSLPLEVEYQDINTYSCVINNPVSTQTRHLDIDQLCQTCSDCDYYWSQTAEAVIRLVVSAVVGVAAVAAVVVLVYDIRSRRAGLEWKVH
ncbi:CD48 antigen-like isoform X2 [Carassius carassius]|uniref:CD48 antigen-like isoform X2 n=1 Tax=Carassius carassius TaxID=217509 RepID=UPI002869572D|nr:CD48 antigen-like isoform X2 [Carassius carassius]